MKSLFLILSLFLGQSMIAKNEIKIVHAKPTVDYTRYYVKLKFKSFQVRSYGFKYEMKVPMNYSGLASITKRIPTNRFGTAKVQFNPRFQNLDKLDLNAIVEKNKTYQLSRNNTFVLRPL